MPDAEHAQILELIPAYALNSLDADEAALVRQHLPGCELCQAELAAYEAVVDALPLAVPEVQPSPSLKGRLMAHIQSESAPDEDVSSPNSPAKPERSWWQQLSRGFQNLLEGPRWRPVLALLIIALVASNLILLYQLNAPDPNSWRRVRLAGTELAPEARGIIYISADGRNGTIIVDGLPQLEPKQQYQLWLIQDGERASGAVFSVDADGYRGVQIESPRPLQEYSAFGVTIEPAGGSPGPTGERVLGTNL